jgi:hypothetical protein
MKTTLKFLAAAALLWFAALWLDTILSDPIWLTDDQITAA